MDKKLTGLMSVFLLSFALFLSLVFLNTNLGRGARASSALKPSAETSFMLAFPLELNASEPSTVTIFVRDPETKPIPQRSVAVSSTIGNLNPSTGITDTDGKITAQFTCNNQTGIAQLNAIIDNTLNVNKVSNY